MKSKTTKRALLSSCIALMLCFSMLLGTTYAWFTDSETSVNNIIQSGTLDATLQYKNEAGAYVDASAGTIYDYQYWEPGYVDVKTVKIGNNGTLAFKFMLNIIPNVKNETTMKLAEVIDVYVLDGEVSRAAVDATVPVGTLKDLLDDADGAAYGVLRPAEDKGSANVSGYEDAPEGEIVMTIALKMQETAGNEYQDLSVGSDTGFVVQLLATQLEYENDCFDNKYDEDAEYPTPSTYVATVQELKTAMLTRGANIVLTDDIVVDANTPLQYGAYMFIANGREVTIDLNGKNIIVDEEASLKTNGLFTTANGGTLNIIGEGTMVVENGKSGIFHAMNKNDQINIYGGTFVSNSDNGSDALAIIYTNSGNVDVYGGKFLPLDGVTCANAEDRQGDRLSIVFHEGTLLKHPKYYAGYDATRIQLAEGCALAEVNIDGETWYKVVKE